MTVKTIKKNDLYDYFDNKFKVRRKEIEAQIDAEIDKTLNPFFDKIFNHQRIGLLYEAFTSLVSEFYEKFAKIIKYHSNIQNAVYHLRTLNDLDANVRSLARKQIKEYAMTPSKGVIDTGIDELNRASAYLATVIPQMVATKSKLNTLSSEIVTVIANAKTGTVAHKNLLALGLSMEDFNPETIVRNLPAIQQFSVDIKLLGSDCKC